MFAVFGTAISALVVGGGIYVLGLVSGRTHTLVMGHSGRGGTALVWLVTGGGYSTCGSGMLAQPGTVDQRGPVTVSVHCRSIDTCTVHIQLNIAAV